MRNTSEESRVLTKSDIKMMRNTIDERRMTSNIEPMLAGKFDADKAEFPCLVQPKINGVRCLWDGVTAWTRESNPFIPEIQTLLSRIDLTGMPGGIVLDGELYIRGESLQRIISVVKRAQPLTTRLRYHVFDIIVPDDPPFTARWDLLKRLGLSNLGVPMTVVQTLLCKNLVRLDEWRDVFIAEGYEGLIYRRPEAKYCHGESASALLKYPVYESAEFTIVGCKEGNGKNAGIPVFICETADGPRFKADMEGPYDIRRQMWLDRESLIGKPLTVRFKELTDRGVPRSPVGVAVRDYEGGPAPARGAGRDAKQPDWNDEVR